MIASKDYYRVRIETAAVYYISHTPETFKACSVCRSKNHPLRQSVDAADEKHTLKPVKTYC
jgi:hypothetical protein